MFKKLLTLFLLASYLLAEDEDMNTLFELQKSIYVSSVFSKKNIKEEFLFSVVLQSNESLNKNSKLLVSEKVSFFRESNIDEKDFLKYKHHKEIVRIINKLALKKFIKGIEFHIGRNDFGIHLKVRAKVDDYVKDFEFQNFKYIEKDQEYQYYSDSSSVHSIIFKRDRNEKEYRFFLENGTVKKIFFVKNQKLNGRYKEFYGDNKLKKEYFYLDGKKNDFYKFYNEDGRLLEKGKYFDSFKNGEFIKYDPNLDVANDEDRIVEIEYYNMSEMYQKKWFNQGKLVKVESF